MDLLESHVEFRIRPGVVYRENRLIPIAGSKMKGRYSFLNGVKRSTIISEDLICCLMLPDGSEGVFIDTEGREYMITKEELHDKLTFINSKFRKTIIPRFLYRRGSKEGYKYLIDKFLMANSTSRRYKGWRSEYGTVGEETLTEAYRPYRVGSWYVSKDGEFTFKIVKKTKNGYRILDKADGKEYEVELSDLELLNARETSVDE